MEAPPCGGEYLWVYSIVQCILFILQVHDCHSWYWTSGIDPERRSSCSGTLFQIWIRMFALFKKGGWKLFMFRLPVSYVWFGYVCSQLFNARVLSRYTRYVHIFFFSDCESNILHQDECRFFQDKDYQMKRRFSEFSSNGTTLNSPLWITPLRMLLKKQTNPKMFDRINMLRDHTAPKVSNDKWYSQFFLKNMNLTL